MESTVASEDVPTLSRREISRVASVLLATSMFFTGASGLVAEYILGAVTSYILGNSIQQMSIVIAVAMLFMGIGGWWQKFMKNDHLVEKFVILEVVLAVLIGFSPIGIYAAFGAVEQHFNLILYTTVGSIGFLIGLEIPLVMRINEIYSSELKVNIGNILSMDYIGSFVGALVWVFFLLKNFPLTEISFLVSATNLFAAIITWIYFWRIGKVHYKKTLTLIVSVTVLLLSIGYSNNRSWNLILGQKLYEDPIVMEETTRYQHLVMTHYDKLDEYRFYINGNTQFSSVDEQIYHEMLVHPVMRLNPVHDRVLILGGGDGLALREVLKYKDVEKIALVDLDPDMVRIASTNPIMRELNADAFKDARVSSVIPSWVQSVGVQTLRQETPEKNPDGTAKTVRIAQVDVVNYDADRFLEEARGSWGIVIIDFPDPSSVELSKLYSKEFFTKLRRLVPENGMVVIQATSPYHAKESYLLIMRTMEAAGFNVLPYHDNVPSFGDWGWILAWRSSVDPEILKTRITQIKDFSVETRYLTPEVLTSALSFGKGWLDSEYDDINTLMYPILLTRYLDDAWQVD